MKFGKAGMEQFGNGYDTWYIAQYDCFVHGMLTGRAAEAGNNYCERQQLLFDIVQSLGDLNVLLNDVVIACSGILQI